MKVTVFKTIEHYEMMKIIDAVTPVEYKAGDTIIKQGEEGDKFFIVDNGEAYATVNQEGGKPAIKVMDYQKGGYFGELALIRNMPRAANVIAKTNCVCLTLDRLSFKRLLGPLEELLKRNSEIYESVTKRLNK